jgi:hypothetical protein
LHIAGRAHRVGRSSRNFFRGDALTLLSDSRFDYTALPSRHPLHHAADVTFLFTAVSHD